MLDRRPILSRTSFFAAICSATMRSGMRYQPEAREQEVEARSEIDEAPSARTDEPIVFVECTGRVRQDELHVFLETGLRDGALALGESVTWRDHRLQTNSK